LLGDFWLKSGDFVAMLAFGAGKNFSCPRRYDAFVLVLNIFCFVLCELIIELNFVLNCDRIKLIVDFVYKKTELPDYNFMLN